VSDAGGVGKLNRTTVETFRVGTVAFEGACASFNSAFTPPAQSFALGEGSAGMCIGARRRKFMSTVRRGITGRVARMGIYYGPEANLGSLAGSKVVVSEQTPSDSSRDRRLSEDPEALYEEWAQPGLSPDAQQRILTLYDEYRPRLYLYLRSMSLGRDWAEEVIQETFMRLTAKLLQKDDIENVQGWVVRVAHNLAMDVFKKERGEVGADESIAFLIKNRADPSLSPEEAYSKNEQSTQMRLALMALKPQQRECFQMRAHGFRYKEIGLALGISEQRAAFVVKQVAVRLAAICG